MHLNLDVMTLDCYTLTQKMINGTLRELGFHLLAAVSAKLGLRSEPRTARSGRTPKYLPFPQPTSATSPESGRLSMNSLTCKPCVCFGETSSHAWHIKECMCTMSRLMMIFVRQ